MFSDGLSDVELSNVELSGRIDRADEGITLQLLLLLITVELAAPSYRLTSCLTRESSLS